MTGRDGTSQSSSLFRFHVSGTQDSYGTIMWPFEDNYEIRAESAPEALLQLINHDLWWDTLDIEMPFTIEIIPVVSG